MKLGRFDESIAMYNKALAIDPNFVALVHRHRQRPAVQGATCCRARDVREDYQGRAEHGRKRTAHFWAAASYVYEGATDKALAEIEANFALSGAEQDGGTQSGDLNLMGDILREAGRVDDALVR